MLGKSATTELHLQLKRVSVSRTVACLQWRLPVRSLAEGQANGWRARAAELRATRLEAGDQVTLMEGLREGQREQGESVGNRLGKHPGMSWISFGD